MQRPVPVQLAIQGGGAKLVPLLAALQAVAHLEEAGQLRVTRVAATSAGAIAGALFAAPVDMDVVKTHLKAKAPLLIDSYAPPTVVRKGWALFWRRPFWNVQTIKSSLLELLGKRKSLSDLERPIRIVATDLKNLKKVVRSQPEDALIDAIMDSCAIPLFFRTPTSDTDGAALIVDGGICANLPSEELIADAQDGEVIGISFETSLIPTNPVGIVGFATTLLNSAMEHAVLRARQSLGSERLLSLRTDIDTFDFRRALTEGLATEWDNCYEQSKDFFQAYVGRTLEHEELRKGEQARLARQAEETAYELARESARRQQLSDALSTIRRTAGDVYLVQEAPKRFAYTRFSVVITAHSLLAEAHEPDTVIRRSIIRAADAPICAHLASTLTERNELPLLDEYQMLDKDGHELRIEQIELDPEYITLDEIAAIRHRKIVYFRAPLQVNDIREPFELRTREKFTGSFAKLRRTKEDTISLRINRVSGTVPIVDLVVQLPKAYSGTKLLPGGLRDEEGQWVDFFQGQEIAQHVLNLEYPAPFGFFSLGWRGLDVVSGTRFGCKINATKGVRK